MRTFDIDDIYDISISDILKQLGGETDICLHYHFRALGSSISNLEVAQEWLNLSYIYDSLKKYAVDASWRREDGIDMFFTIPQCEASNFIKALKKVTYYLEFGHNDDSSEYFFNIGKYRSDDPRMMESFYANYVSRGLFEEPSNRGIDEEVFFIKVFSEHPEWRYGLWQCHKQGIADGEVLYSQYCWVIDSSKREHVFETIYGYKPAFHLCLQKDDILFTERAACRISDIGNISDAKTWVTSHEDSAGPVKYYLSDDGDIFLMDYGSLAIVYFDFSPVSGEQLLNIYHAEQETISTLAKLVRERAAISYQWENLNDDTFQSLCQKLLCRISRFRDARIEPVGKTRSRDGGRDFLIYTTERPGIPAMKYIVQCKYKKDNGSLTRSKMGDIGTTIGQFNADGYVIMTNGLLDATLIDSLEGFSNNHRFQTDISCQYTRTQLEHYLDLNPDMAQEFGLLYNEL